MSVAGYLGPCGPRVVVEKERVEESVVPEDLRADGGSLEVYEGVEEYDPVLRSHCRL